MSHENKDTISAFRDKGYRVTSQRLIVLDAVCENPGHATIAAILSSVDMMDSTIDPSTVYRALDVLRDVGLIVESEIEGTGKIYRVAGESEHHHLVCSTCGTILTIHQEDVATLIKEIRAEYGFEIQTDHLVFNGICQKCQNSQ